MFFVEICVVTKYIHILVAVCRDYCDVTVRLCIFFVFSALRFMYVLCTVRNVRSIDRSAFAFAVSVSNMASCGMEFYRQRLLSFVYAFRRDLCSN